MALEVPLTTFTEAMDNMAVSESLSEHLPTALPSAPQAPEQYEPIHPDSRSRP